MGLAACILIPTHDSDAAQSEKHWLRRGQVAIMSMTVRKPWIWTDLVLLFRLLLDKMGTLSRNHIYFPEFL